MPKNKTTKLAKLTRPKLHNVLARERLFALLDAGRERALVWVVGPPGAGKTALTASYLDARKLGGVWYHLDASDHDPATFFHYLSRTLELAKGQAPLPVITAEHLADLPAFTRYYFREFYARLKAPAVLAFDNYHEIPSTSRLHGVLEQAAQEAPEDIALIIISREEPPTEFSRLDALDRLARVEWNDLKLTLDEATSIAQLRLELDAPTLRSLYEISKGWAAGLTLALERMKRSDADVRHIQSEALESVFNYFADQIFKTAEPEVREFLMKSALLQRITGEMAAQLTGNANAVKLLDTLYRRRLFTDRRGAEPYSYQYHDLFRTFLLDRLGQLYGVAQLNELRKQAGRLLENAQRFDEAFALYKGALDWEAVAELGLKQAQSLIGEGRGKTLREWIDALPPSVQANNAWLNYWHATSILTSEPDEARRHLANGYELFVKAGDAFGQIRCCAAMVSAYFVDFSDFRPLDVWVDRLSQLLSQIGQTLSPSVKLQICAVLANYAHVRKPQAEYFNQVVQEGAAILETDMPMENKIVPAYLLIHGLREAGRLIECEQIVNIVQRHLASETIDGSNLAHWWQAIAWMAASSGDKEAARKAIARSREVCISHALVNPAREQHINLVAAAVAFQEGNLAMAESVATEIEKLNRWNERGWANWIKSIVASMRDDAQSAVKFAQREFEVLSEGGAVFHLYYAHLHIAGGLIGLQRFDKAHDEIEKARAILVDTFEYRNLADVDLMAAWLDLQRDDMQRFDTHVRAAFDLLKRTELHACLWYVDQRILPAVLARALARGVESKEVSHYIRYLKMRPPPDAGADWPWPLKIFTLGRFEVLRDDAPLESSRKPAKKPLALLKLLACAGGAAVPVSQALDALWPESEADSAEKAFDVALHRLRALLGSNEAVRLADGRVSLDRARVWVDAWAFEALCREGGDAARCAAELYQGALLPEELDTAWSVSYREKLHDSFNRLICTQAAVLESQQRHGEALAWYARGLEADDLVEAMYQGMMRCHIQLGRRADALASFQRLRRTLASKLRTLPSAESVALAGRAESA